MENINNDSDLFEQILQNLLNNKTDIPPVNPSELDFYVDLNNNLHMFVKSEWISVGINFSQLLSKE